MRCEEVRALLDAFVDAELDLRASMDVEAHLSECAACAEEVRARLDLQDAIAGAALYYPAPPEVRRRVENSVKGRSYPVAMWLTPVAAALVLVFLALPRLGTSATEQAVVSNHVRSLMPNHLLDVPSSDQHTVKPWFNGRVDFSPPVKDPKAEGFALVGGRLDYLRDRTVAVLVYERRRHVINVSVWPSSHGDSEVNASTRQGYNLLHWTRAGFEYWAVSDLNARELAEFAKLLRE